MPHTNAPSRAPALRRRVPSSLLPLLLMLVCWLVPIRSQATEDDAQLWMTGTASKAFGDGWRANLLVQLRFRDDLEDFERILVNPSLGRDLGRGFSAEVGYDAHALRSPRDRLEHRTWQQLAYAHDLEAIGLPAVDVLHRLRLEERFLEGEDGVASRLRWLVGGSVPIVETRWKAVLRNEAFFDLDAKRQGPTEAGFGETRIFAGFDRALGDSAGLEIGYQLQYVDRRRSEDFAAHTIWIALRWSD